MEPLFAATVALGTVIGTKALEKTGEKLGEAVFDKTKKFMDSLRHESPETVTAIELAPAQPLDYTQTVSRIQSAAQGNHQLAQAIQELAAAAQTNPNPTVNRYIKEVENNLQSQQPSVNNQNFGPLQEKGVINQGNIGSQTNNF